MPLPCRRPAALAAALFAGAAATAPAPAAAATPDCAGLMQIAYDAGASFRLGGIDMGVLIGPQTMLVCPAPEGVRIETDGNLQIEALDDALNLAHVIAGGNVMVETGGAVLVGGDPDPAEGELVITGSDELILVVGGDLQPGALDDDTPPLTGDAVLQATGSLTLGGATPTAALTLAAVAVETPVPAAAPLLIAALGGIAALRRRG